MRTTLKWKLENRNLKKGEETIFDCIEGWPPKGVFSELRRATRGRRGLPVRHNGGGNPGPVQFVAARGWG